MIFYAHRSMPIRVPPKCWLGLLVAMIWTIPLAFGGESQLQSQPQPQPQPQPLLVVKYLGSTPSVDESYYLALIEQALTATDDLGPYKVEYSQRELSSERKQDLLVEGDQLNIDRLVGFEDRLGLRRGLIKVKQPLLFGFMGFRVPLIRADTQAMFNQINSYEQLKKIPLGLGKGWEGYIYRRQGFPLSEPINMTLLLKMLAGGRFDYVPLSAIEIEDNYSIDGKLVASLKPERHLLIHLPQPVYFYVSPDAPALAARLEAGLGQLRDQGVMWRLFKQYFGERLQRLNLKQRQVIEVPNPEDDGSLNFAREQLLNEF